jgi:hypothetical protein
MAFDGGDFFTYDSANETWMQNIHKDNAKFTLLTWWMPGDFSATQGLFGTRGNGNPAGFIVNVLTGATVQFVVSQGSGNALSVTSTAAFSAGAWSFLAISVDEGAAFGLRQINGTQETFASAYTSPSAGSAAQTFQIGARGNAAGPLSDGSRMALACAWEGVALTAAEVADFHDATRERFGV